MSGELWAVKVKGEAGSWWWLDSEGFGYGHKKWRVVGDRKTCSLAIHRRGAFSPAEDIRFVRIKRKPKAATVDAKKVVGWAYRICSMAIEAPDSWLGRDCAQKDIGDAVMWHSKAKAEEAAGGIIGKAVPYYADGTVGE